MKIAHLQHQPHPAELKSLRQRLGRLNVSWAHTVTQIISQVGTPGLDDSKNQPWDYEYPMHIQKQSVFKMQALASFNVLHQLIFAIYAR